LRGVVLRDRQLKQFSIMNSDSGPETLVGPPQDVVAWEWSPDGSRVLFAVRERDSVAIRAVDVPGGASRVVATIAGSETVPFAVLSGGGLAVISSGTRLRRIGVPGLTDSILDLPGDFIGVTAVSSSPDGRAVAIIGPDRKLDSIFVNRVSLVNGHANRVAALLFDPTGDPPAWLADGSLVVSVKLGQTVEWYRVPAGGGRPIRLDAAPWGTATYRWSADGRRILATVPNDLADVYAIRNFGVLLNR
jgi:dipeptidyl aminopeptidase/acylaminoacyl peptidase